MLKKLSLAYHVKSTKQTSPFLFWGRVLLIRKEVSRSRFLILFAKQNRGSWCTNLTIDYGHCLVMLLWFVEQEVATTALARRREEEVETRPEQVSASCLEMRMCAQISGVFKSTSLLHDAWTAWCMLQSWWRIMQSGTVVHALDQLLMKLKIPLFVSLVWYGITLSVLVLGLTQI